MQQEEFDGQEPPYHLESEQSIIGALMLDNQAFDRIGDLVSELDFFTRDHRYIFRAMTEILNRNQPLDLITLAENLDSRKQLEDVGGLAYLGSLVQNTPTAAHIERYAQIVRDKSLMRTMAQIADEIRKRVFNPNGATAKELLDFAQGKFMAIGDNSAKGDKSQQSMQQILPKLVEHIDTHFMKWKSGEDCAVIGLETGLTDIDELTTGLQGGDLVIIAGRPSMGKTALAINFAEHACVNLNQHVQVFSFEMSAQQLTNRMLASTSGINSQRLWTGRIYEQEWDNLSAGIGKLNQANIHIDEDATLTVGDIKARARRLHREVGGLKLIVIDYLQLISTKNSGNRAEDLSEISRELKRLAKELDVPVVALSQLSRSVEGRPNKRPIMSDIRESGAIEQDADVIMFVYRDEYYNLDSSDKGTAEINIAKQRNGPVGVVRAVFDANLTKFKNYVPMREDDGSGFN